MGEPDSEDQNVTEILPSYLKKRIPEKTCFPEQVSDATDSGAFGNRQLLENFHI